MARIPKQGCRKSEEIRPFWPFLPLLSFALLTQIPAFPITDGATLSTSSLQGKLESSESSGRAWNQLPTPPKKQHLNVTPLCSHTMEDLHGRFLHGMDPLVESLSAKVKTHYYSSCHNVSSCIRVQIVLQHSLRSWGCQGKVSLGSLLRIHLTYAVQTSLLLPQCCPRDTIL